MYAQDFAPIGAEWYYTERHAFCGDETYLKITSIRDTIVNGKECRMLQKLGNPMCSGRPDIEILHQEDSVVFFWDTTFYRFQTLYDLTKDINESWIIEVIDEWNDSNKDTIKITVNSISTVDINGKSLKKLSVTYLVITENHPYSYKSNIIEKIGDMNYLFNYYPYSSVACDGNYSAGLRCYEDSELGLFSTGIADSCNYIYRWTSIEENESNFEFNIYPNPTFGQFTISTESKTEYTFEMTDFLGRIIKSGYVNENSKFDISSFPSGLYILLIKEDMRAIATRKLLKY